MFQAIAILSEKYVTMSFRLVIALQNMFRNNIMAYA
jgi:hypothetical protein